MRRDELLRLRLFERRSGGGGNGSCVDRYPPLADNRVLSGADRNFHIHEADHGSAHGRGVWRVSIAVRCEFPAWRSHQGWWGIRKVRVAVGSRGKSGGARVIYYWAVRGDIVLLLYAIPRTSWRI
jgi:hypothetical protein